MDNTSVNWLVIEFKTMFFKSKTFAAAMDNRVYTVSNKSILLTGDQDLWSYDSRSQINPDTNLPYMDGT